MNMNSNKLIRITLGFLILINISCEKDVIAPEISFSATPTSALVDEEVTFNISGTAETFVIFNGESGHEFINSHIAVNEGQQLNLSNIVLTSEGFESMKEWVGTKVESYNFNRSNPVDLATVLSTLEQMVDVNYVNKEVPEYLITTSLFPDDPEIGKTIVETYFEDKGILLAPDGGYSIGIALNRYSPVYSHSYSQPGIYTATLVATNVSDKNYSGNGYIDDRTSSASEYNFKREIKHVIITVEK